MLKAGIFLMLAMMMCGNALAATYYVTQEGTGEKTGSGLQDAMSLQAHNTRTFSPGDTIYLCGRMTSLVSPPSSGNAGSKIIYSGKCPGSPGVIDFVGNPQMRLNGKDHLIIEDLELKNGVNGITSSGSCDHITIRRCKIHDMKEKGITFTQTPQYLPGAQRNTNIIIGGAPGDGNDIYDAGMGTGGSDVQLAATDGWVVSHNHLYATKSQGLESDRGIDGVTTHDSSNGLIEYNEIHSHNDDYHGSYSAHGWNGKGEDGIDLKEGTRDVIIRFNHIYDHKHQSGIHPQRNSQRITIYGNYVHDNGANGIGVYGGATTTPICSDGISTKDITIFGNIVTDNGVSGISVQHSQCNDLDGDGKNDPPDPVLNVKIFNNVIAFNGVDRSSDTGIRITSGSGHEVRNNILYKNRPLKDDALQAYVTGSQSTAFSDNIYHWPGRMSTIYLAGATVSATSVGQRNLDKDPLFAAPQAGDFRTVKASPALKTGNAFLGETYGYGLGQDADFSTIRSGILSWVDRDSYGGPGWDIGAFESLAGTIAVPACGNTACEAGETCQACPADCGVCPEERFTPGVVIEAERGILTAPMQEVSDASGVRYINTPVNYEGSVTYAFNIIDQGDYFIEARIIAPTTSDDSFYVGLDGEQAYKDESFTWDVKNSAAWKRVNVSRRGDGNHTDAQHDPMVWTLTAGEHRFTFYGRESGTGLDSITLKTIPQGKEICKRGEAQPCDGCVTMGELGLYITRWRNNDPALSLYHVIEAIQEWKKGC